MTGLVWACAEFGEIDGDQCLAVVSSLSRQPQPFCQRPGGLGRGSKARAQFLVVQHLDGHRQSPRKATGMVTGRAEACR